MKKRMGIFVVLILSLLITSGVVTYITYENQRREAALREEANAKAAIDIQNVSPVQEIKEVESKVKTEEAKKAEPVKAESSKPVKTVSAVRTSTPSRGTKPSVKSGNGISEADRDLFYRLVSAEAAGESLEGKLAVATIVMNRVKVPTIQIQ